MSNEIRRRRTDSPEVDALVVIEQAMELLDRPARARVIEWAKQRFVKDYDNGTLGTVTEWLKGMYAAAEDLNITPEELAKAAAAFKEHADAQATETVVES